MGLFSKKRAVPEIGDGPAESFEVRWRRDLTHERYIDESALWQRVHGHYEQSEVRWAASPVYVRFSDADWDGYVYLTDERLIVEMHNPTEMQWGILSRPIPELQLVTWDLTWLTFQDRR
ncbi:hypothetical protein [Microbispora sp. CSR-4]|uniref:hypothetical protein n=1 Tax=Microbispora sp. CSR-4 TaxID=2592813 RepID=UPI0011C7572C|nr:hypothetical protein [Microbispora sp. CSR-4]